jgi:hypothetical protein
MLEPPIAYGYVFRSLFGHQKGGSGNSIEDGSYITDHSISDIMLFLQHRAFGVLSFVAKCLRDIAGLHTKVKNYCRSRIGGHRGKLRKTLLNRTATLMAAEH